MKHDDSDDLIRNIAPFGVRMPPALKERVQAAAKAANRSLNAEIVAALEEKYPVPEVRQDLEDLKEAMTALYASTSDADFRQRLLAANAILAPQGMEVIATHKEGGGYDITIALLTFHNRPMPDL
ncbi:MAG: Arc family DNA-binding protein [Cypionkella sp.]